MPTRAEVVADAAVTVLARDGLRGLTHRAVDAQAALPDGSTSNCFRSRTALLNAVLDRLEELDMAALRAGPPPDASSIRTLADHLARNVALMTTDRHSRATRARIALLLDETARPAIDAGHGRFLGMVEGLLAETGHPDPASGARAVSDLLDGALVHAVSVRSRGIDVDELARAIERLLS